MKSNLQLQKDVQDELKWESSLIDDEIFVSAEDGIVTLTGIVNSLVKKQSAISAAKQVIGVKALTIKIGVKAMKSAYFTESTFGDSENILSNTDENMLRVSGA